MSLHQLQRMFAAHDIDYSTPGFYDLDAFREVERRDPDFLIAYSEYVEALEFDNEYLARSRETVRQLATMLFDELRRANLAGACVNTSGALVRMLEQERLWSYAVGGGVTVNFPDTSGIPPSHFGVIAPRQVVAAHMWVRVPPFQVVDITLPFQNWNPQQQHYIRDFVISEESERAQYTVWELVDVNVLMQFQLLNGRDMTLRDVRDIAPHVFPFMARFPAFQVGSGELQIKYVPTKTGASEEGLYELIQPVLNGRRPGELYAAFRARNHP